MLIAFVVALLMLAVTVPEAQGKGPPAVGCPEHIEGPGPPPAPNRARDVTRGVMTLMGARLLQRHRVPLERTGRARLGIMLEAGHEATITVDPASREIATLEYRFEGGRRVGEWQMDFQACPADAPRFGGPGTVGPRTVWTGGLHVRRPGCVRLKVRVDGGVLQDVRLPLGRPCRPPADLRSLGCPQRSLASFPDAWSDPRNLVVGPMTLVGGAEAARRSAGATMRRLGWWKAPLLLRQGERVTLSVAWESRRVARLGYGSAGEARAVRFAACDDGVRSDSDVNTWRVTFWSGGFTLRRLPACVAVDVWVAGSPASRLRMPFGDPAACAGGSRH